MEDIKLPIKPTPRKGFKLWLLRDKLKSPAGIILLLLGTIAFSFITVKYGLGSGLVKPYYTGSRTGYFRHCIVPVVRDYGAAGHVLLCDVVFTHGRELSARHGHGRYTGPANPRLPRPPEKDPRWSIFRDPVSWMILLWIGYNLIEVINPWSASRLAWLYTVRSTALVMLMYFIFTYYIRSLNYIRLIFKVWIGLSIFAAIYAFKQDQFGFFGFEERQLSDPLIQSLLFIGGYGVSSPSSPTL